MFHNKKKKKKTVIVTRYTIFYVEVHRNNISYYKPKNIPIQRAWKKKGKSLLNYVVTRCDNISEPFFTGFKKRI